MCSSRGRAQGYVHYRKPSFPPCQGSTAKEGRSAPQKRDAFGPSFAVPAVNFNGKWRRDPAAAVPLYWGTFWLPPYHRMISWTIYPLVISEPHGSATAWPSLVGTMKELEENKPPAVLWLPLLAHSSSPPQRSMLLKCFSHAIMIHKIFCEVTRQDPGKIKRNVEFHRCVSMQKNKCI